MQSCHDIEFGYTIFKNVIKKSIDSCIGIRLWLEFFFVLMELKMAFSCII